MENQWQFVLLVLVWIDSGKAWQLNTIGSPMGEVLTKEIHSKSSRDNNDTGDTTSTKDVTGDVAAIIISTQHNHIGHKLIWSHRRQTSPKECVAGHGAQSKPSSSHGASWFDLALFLWQHTESRAQRFARRAWYACSMLMEKHGWCRQYLNSCTGDRLSKYKHNLQSPDERPTHLLHWRLGLV